MLQVSADCNNNNIVKTDYYIVKIDYETVFYIEKPMKSIGVLILAYQCYQLKSFQLFINYDIH